MRKIIALCLGASMLSCGITKKGVVETVGYKEADFYAKTISSQELKEHLTVLASDEYEGRETAMPGQKKAAEYITNYFKSIGLAPGAIDSYQQSFPVVVKDPSKVEITVGEHQLSFLEDFFYIGSFADTNMKDLELVYLNYGVVGENYSDYKDIDVQGKVVVIKEGVPEGVQLKGDWNNWRKKIAVAESHGAVALFTIKNDFEDRVERIKYYVQNPRMELHNKGNQKKITSIPNLFISPAVAQNKFKIVEENYPMLLPEKVSLNLAIDQILSSENVLGFIEGTDLKDEVVVVTAHYDHLGYDAGEVCNGADDDGSGTVAVLALAKAFSEAKAKGHSPRRSILFMTVSGEEKGLLGSQYYTENPVYPLENTVVNLNIDMIGRVDDHHTNNNYVYLIGSDKISSDLHDINEKMNKDRVKLELDYTYNDEADPNRFYYRSDHYNFAKNDIPVIFYFSGTHIDYHKPTDDVDKIDFEKIEKTTKLVFYTAWEVANRKSSLNRINK
ncbi:MAG: M28 family peptidase [Flavobacteriales bacterium]|jgi:hypothetical protein|nr:M28 family peptidase [Flavobacteriales bacterium]